VGDRMPLNETEVNIREFPDAATPEELDALPHNVYTLGDLHGNAMKLIFILQKYGVLELKQSDFEALWKVYDTPIGILTKPENHDLTLRVFNKFDETLKRVKKNKPGLLVLIGDELADRGKNDWFTLLVLNALHNANIPFQIQLSNHSLQALAFFSGARTGMHLGEGQEASLHNCYFLLKAFPELKPRLNELTTMYKTHLSLIGYQFNTDTENQLILYTHAPIDTQTIELVALEFNILDLDLSTASGLVDCIDKINAKFSENIQKNHFIKNYIHAAAYQKASQKSSITQTSGLFELFWNRDLVNFPRNPCDAIFKNIHGHIGPAASVKCYENLDNHLGKPAETWLDSSGGTVTAPAADEGSLRVYVAPLQPVDKTHQYYRKAMAQTTLIAEVGKKRTLAEDSQAGKGAGAGHDEDDDDLDRTGPGF
jgi:hypothetical protein